MEALKDELVDPGAMLMRQTTAAARPVLRVGETARILVVGQGMRNATFWAHAASSRWPKLSEPG